METIVYGKIGAEDIQVGRSQFEVTLGDGRIAALNEVNLDSFDKLLSVEDATANDVTTVLTVRHTTTGTPAAGIGAAIVFQTESGDEDPSDAMAIEAANDDVTAGSEDTTFWVRLRRAGAALARSFGFRNTGTNSCLLLTVPTADRTLTLPDATDTLVGRATTDTMSNKTLTDALHNAGSGSETFRADGHISINTTGVATTAIVTEENLLTFSLPANSLSVNGYGVRIRAWGQVAANANGKTLKLYFGNSIVASNNVSLAPNAVAWLLEAEVWRTGAQTQDAIGKGQVGSIPQSVFFNLPTEDTTGAITIKITGQNGTATAADITAEGLSVAFLNA